MKLRFLLFVGFTVCVANLPSCNGTETADSDDSIQVSIDRPDSERSRRPDRSRAALADVLSRADAAFSELEGHRRVRLESHIGLQPWPDDLPTRWPIPKQARVVAVAIQRQGNRLLLVDLPGSPRASLEFYRDALRERGYHVPRPESQNSTRALYAKSADTEAVLTFFDRKHGTRLEILFVAHGSG